MFRPFFGIVNFLCSFVHILSLKEVEFIRKLVRRTNQKNQRTERGKPTEKEKVVRFYFGISDLFNILTRYGHQFCWVTSHNESRTTCVTENQPDVLQLLLWNSKWFQRIGITNQGDCHFEEQYSFVGCHRSFHVTKCIWICMTHTNRFGHNSTSNLKCMPSVTRWPRKPKSKHSNISFIFYVQIDHSTTPLSILHTLKTFKCKLFIYWLKSRSLSLPLLVRLCALLNERYHAAT